MSKITPPWDDETIRRLNDYQRSGRFHPYTCGNDRSNSAHTRQAKASGDEPGLLVATRDGWRCPACKYKQTWAHGFSAE